MCQALIDGDILLSLTEVDLQQDLGVARLAERRRLCDAIRHLARHAKYAQVRSIVDNINRKVGPGPGLKVDVGRNTSQDDIQIK